MDEMIKLADIEGGYQPLDIKGVRIYDGWRECDSRWEVIKPRLIDGQMVVDIGSHYGFFAEKIAEQYPNSMVWSIEADPRRAEIQRRMLLANGQTNVVLSPTKFDLRKSALLAESCFVADVIMMLSVAHYFDPKELPYLIHNLSLLAPELIIEFPSRDEREVAAKDNVHSTDIEAILLNSYSTVERVGTGKSPKHDDVQRIIYHARNTQIQRDLLPSHIDGGRSPRSHRVTFDGQWTLDGYHHVMEPALNLADLRHFGMIYPDHKLALLAAAKGYDQLIRKHKGAVTDIHIRNVLMMPLGAQIIDYTEGIGNPTIYDMTQSDYRKRTMGRSWTYHLDEFEQMWEGTWRP